MALPITSGRQAEAQRVVIHGPAGVGKSSLAALISGVVFLDIEGSTGGMDVKRLPKPSSWAGVLGLLNEFTKDTMGFNALAVDTADWAEALAIPQVCAQHNITALGGNNDYGHSYGLLDKEWGRFLDALTAIADRGVHVVLLAHTTVKKREVPDEFGAFDRWVLKMEKRTSAKTIEWAKSVWFLNTKVFVVEDGKTKTKKGTDGGRFLYTSEHPCWDAKSRDELPEEIAYKKGILPDAIAPLFTPMAAKSAPAPAAAPAPTPAPPAPATEMPAHIRQLTELMMASGIDPKALMTAVAAKGHFPADTPFANLPAEYVQGALLPHWDKVVASIKGAQSNG